MLRKSFPPLPGQFLVILALTSMLVVTSWAQPKFKILHAVPGGLFGGLTFDAKGNLYGVTGAGGDHNDGTIFELTPGAHGWTLTTLHSFNGQDGGTPNGGLIFDSAGNMYGTTVAGGKAIYGGGTVFEMARGSSGWTFNVLYEFCLKLHCPDGSAPEAGVILDNEGNLHGTTSAGGEHSGGTVFELTHGSGGWGEHLLYSFCSKVYCHDGQAPVGGLILPRAGNFYGTTLAGGVYGGGSVFKLKRSSGGGWSERVLYSFCSDGPPACKDGVGLYAGVALDGSGNLYGTTPGGGGTCDGEPCGTVFELIPTSGGHWKEEIIWGFPDTANGFYPSSGLVFDKMGNLYGATAQGGGGSCYDGCGVVYKLTPAAHGKWNYRVLHKFVGNSGSLPPGNLVLDEKGNLYGTAYGAVFEITP